MILFMGIDLIIETLAGCLRAQFKAGLRGAAGGKQQGLVLVCVMLGAIG
jgi:hypothetical protein